MGRHTRIALFLACCFSLTPQAAAAQGPCSEEGPDCRPLTAAESKAFVDRMAALKAALPVPDTTRYTTSSLGAFVEAMTEPAIGAMGGYQGPTICHSWPAGCFPTENDLWFTYSPKEVREKAEKETKDLYTLAQSFGNEMASRIEVNAWLRPHPYLVENVDGKCVDVTEESAKVLEKTPTYLAYQKGDEESASLNMIFGPRTCQEEETLNLDHPAKNLAPVVSVELIVSGPPAEVAALKEKISRKAFEALLGPLVK